MSNTAVSSVKSAIENPNTYYYSSAPGNWTWYGFNDISLWSDYSTKSKSIYDPCPYGYRVPINGSWAGFPAVSLGSVKIDNGSAWLNTWWPIAGRRGNTSGAIETVGTSAYYWSSSRHSGAYRSYSLYFDYNGGVLPSNNYNRSLGFSVRCVQEEPQSAKPPITRLSCFLDFATQPNAPSKELKNINPTTTNRKITIFALNTNTLCSRKPLQILPPRV